MMMEICNTDNQKFVNTIVFFFFLNREDLTSLQMIQTSSQIQSVHNQTSQEKTQWWIQFQDINLLTKELVGRHIKKLRSMPFSASKSTKSDTKNKSI